MVFHFLFGNSFAIGVPVHPFSVQHTTITAKSSFEKKTFQSNQQICYLHNPIFNLFYVIMRHSVTSLMTSLKFISNSTYWITDLQMCQRKFRPMKYTCHYSYANFGTFFGPPSITNHWSQLSHSSLHGNWIEYRPAWLGLRRGALACVNKSISCLRPAYLVDTTR